MVSDIPYFYHGIAFIAARFIAARLGLLEKVTAMNAEENSEVQLPEAPPSVGT
jgi:hypothetical protein